MRSSSTTCPEARRESGFTLVSAVFLVVVLAALGSALANIAVREQMGSAAEVEAARVQQAARAGLEWGAFQVLRNPVPPAAAPACFASTNFSPAGLTNYTVTVSCTQTAASDGATNLVFYQLVATACNSPTAGACPNSATAPTISYVERQLSWTMSR